MRLRHVIAVGLVVAAAGCDNRNGLGVGPNDGGASGGAGGRGSGGAPGGTGGSICPARPCVDPLPPGAVGGPTAGCANGYKKDAAGCETCECNPPSTCPPLRCAAVACPAGSSPAVDAQGCPTCGCSAPTCPTAACFLYCPYGRQTGADGCQLCACNPGTCRPEECPAPPPLPPGTTCANGAFSPPVCQRNAAGTCGWLVPPCPGACSRASNQGTCSSIPGCVWLQPGCAEPSIPTAGCYPTTSLGCAEGNVTCPADKQCQKRTINPCLSTTATPPVAGTASDGAAARPAPPAEIVVPACPTCAQAISICL
jgi:hypothetical protein